MVSTYLTTTVSYRAWTQPKKCFLSTNHPSYTGGCYFNLTTWCSVCPPSHNISIMKNSNWLSWEIAGSGSYVSKMDILSVLLRTYLTRGGSRSSNFSNFNTFSSSQSLDSRGLVIVQLTFTSYFFIQVYLLSFPTMQWMINDQFMKMGLQNHLL